MTLGLGRESRQALPIDAASSRPSWDRAGFGSVGSALCRPGAGGARLAHGALPLFLSGARSRAAVRLGKCRRSPILISRSPGARPCCCSACRRSGRRGLVGCVHARLSARSCSGPIWVLMVSLLAMAASAVRGGRSSPTFLLGVSAVGSRDGGHRSPDVRHAVGFSAQSRDADAHRGAGLFHVPRLWRPCSPSRCRCGRLVGICGYAALSLRCSPGSCSPFEIVK